MKITFITPQAPEVYGGGGMLIWAHLLALSSLLGIKNIMYIGPKPCTIDLSQYVGKAYYVPSVRRSQKMKAILTQKHYTTLGIFFDQCKQELLKHILDFSSLVWVEFTKTGHLVEELRKHGCSIACYAHNYEYAYYLNSEKTMFNIFNKSIALNEKLSCRYANWILGDSVYAKLIRDAYGNGGQYQHLSFFSYKDQVPDKPQKIDAYKYVVLSGSFSYGHNRGVLEPLMDSWSRQTNPRLYLGICGSGMEKMGACLKKNANILIFNRPIDEYPIIENAEIYINPFTSPSGVLTRNLVAMSAGVPIVGLKTSFRGYQVQHMKEVIMCDKLEDIIPCLTSLIEESVILDELRMNLIKKFYGEYSFCVGKRHIGEIVDSFSYN